MPSNGSPRQLIVIPDDDVPTDDSPQSLPSREQTTQGSANRPDGQRAVAQARRQARRSHAASARMTSAQSDEVVVVDDSPQRKQPHRGRASSPEAVNSTESAAATGQQRVGYGPHRHGEDSSVLVVDDGSDALATAHLRRMPQSSATHMPMGRTLPRWSPDRPRWRMRALRRPQRFDSALDLQRRSRPEDMPFENDTSWSSPAIPRRPHLSAAASHTPTPSSIQSPWQAAAPSEDAHEAYLALSPEAVNSTESAAATGQQRMGYGSRRHREDSSVLVVDDGSDALATAHLRRMPQSSATRTPLLDSPPPRLSRNWPVVRRRDVVRWRDVVRRPDVLSRSSYDRPTPFVSDFESPRMSHLEDTPFEDDTSWSSPAIPRWPHLSAAALFPAHRPGPSSIQSPWQAAAPSEDTYEAYLALDERVTPVGLTHLDRRSTVQELNAATAAALVRQTLRCPICLDDFEAGQQIRRLPCLDVFHRHCVDRHFESSTICPLCRYDLRTA